MLLVSVFPLLVPKATLEIAGLGQLVTNLILSHKILPLEKIEKPIFKP